MKPVAATLALVFVPAAALAAGPTRTLTHSQSAEGLKTLSIEAGVGEVEVRAADTQTVVVEIEIEASRRMFGSRERAIERAELRAEVRGGTLHIEVDDQHHGDRDFSERWEVVLPHALALKLELGVGDVRVVDVGSDTDVEVGVGNVRVEGEHARFARVQCEAGVGDVDLRTPGERHDAEGFIGRSVSAKGPGASRLAVEAGVGDVIVRLR